MRAPTQRAVPGLEKRTFQGNTVTRCGLTRWGNREVQGDGQILNSGWLVSHCLTQGTWEEGQVGVGPRLNLAENMLCWRTHETSSLTKCALKTLGQFSGLFQFLSPPSPCLPPSLPPLQKPNLQTKTVKNAFETVSVFIGSIEHVYQHNTHMGIAHCLTHSIKDCLYKCC